MISEPEMRNQLIRFVDRLSFGSGLAKRFSRERFGPQVNHSKWVWKQILADGIIIPVYVVDLGGNFVSERTDVPATVVFTFDKKHLFDKPLMTSICQMLRDFSDQNPTDRDAREASKILSTNWMTVSRRRVPLSLTSNVPVYVARTILDRDLLKHHEARYLDEIVCVASPEQNGRIANIPWWIVEGAPEERLDIAKGLDFRVIIVGVIAALLLIALFVAANRPTP